MKIYTVILILSLFLISCSLGEKTPEEKLEENFKNDIETIKDDLYNTPIGSKEFADKATNFENNVGLAMEKNMYDFQINQLIEDGDDLTIPRDIMYSISIFDDTKDISSIEKQLINKGFRIGEKQDVFGMMMFYVFKKHPVDTSIIAKDEKELNSIINVDWLSYDGWDCEIAK